MSEAKWLDPNPSNEEYHARPELGSSLIKEVRKSPKHFKAMLDGQVEISNGKQARFDLGTCMHSVVLEQRTDCFLEGPKVSSKSVKAWKEAKAEADEIGKILLTPDEYKRVTSAFESFCQHPKAEKLVSRCGHIEQSGIFKDQNTGLDLKIRPDGLCLDDDYVFIFDYKTTSDLSKRSLERTIANLGYHVSAAHYMAGVEAITGRPVKDYFLCFQESKAPYDTVVFLLDPTVITQGDMIRRRALDLIADCRDKDFWPGTSDSIDMISIPAYAWESENEFIFSEEEAS